MAQQFEQPIDEETMERLHPLFKNKIYHLVICLMRKGRKRNQFDIIDKAAFVKIKFKKKWSALNGEN